MIPWTKKFDNINNLGNKDGVDLMPGDEFDGSLKLYLDNYQSRIAGLYDCYISVIPFRVRGNAAQVDSNTH